MSGAPSGGSLLGFPVPQAINQSGDSDDDDDKHDSLVPWNTPPERVWMLFNKTMIQTNPSERDAAEYSRRPLSLVGPDEGIVLFDTVETRNFLNYCIMALRLPINPDNVFWLAFMNDYDAITLQAIEMVSQRAPGAAVVLRNPQGKTAELCHAHNLTLDNDFELPNKEWLHSKERGVLASITLRDPKTGKPVKVHKPRGFATKSKDKLVQGYATLKAALGPEGKIVAKLTNLTAGTGVFLDVDEAFVKTLKCNKNSPVVLEEMLTCDPLPFYPQYQNAPSVHFVGREPYGPVCSQLIVDGKFFNGVACPAIGMDESTRKYILAVGRALARQFKFRAAWGLDFLICGGKPMLIDLNFGRLNNTHFSKMMLESHDLLGQPFQSFKRKIPTFPNGLTTIWALLLSRDLAFSPDSRSGIAILAFDNGKKASFVATSPDPKVAENLEQQCSDILKEMFRQLHPEDAEDGTFVEEQ